MAAAATGRRWLIASAGTTVAKRRLANPAAVPGCWSAPKPRRPGRLFIVVLLIVTLLTTTVLLMFWI
jgi:hypothetical protein